MVGSSVADLPPMGKTPMNKKNLHIETPVTPASSQFLGGVQHVNGVAEMWTPVGMARNNTNNFNTSVNFKSTAGLGGLGPNTPHGKALMNQTMHQLNLPPEEWANDVRDLNGQLIECLEQLYERETELEDHKKVITSLEENLIAVKQQTTSLYYDYTKKSDAWESKMKQLEGENKTLNEERDNLRLKLRRFQETNQLLQNEEDEAIQTKLTELTRKVTIYEVNESILSRKFVFCVAVGATERGARLKEEGGIRLR